MLSFQLLDLITHKPPFMEESLHFLQRKWSSSSHFSHGCNTSCCWFLKGDFYGFLTILPLKKLLDSFHIFYLVIGTFSRSLSTKFLPRRLTNSPDHFLISKLIYFIFFSFIYLSNLLPPR